MTPVPGAPVFTGAIVIVAAGLPEATVRLWEPTVSVGTPMPPRALMNATVKKLDPLLLTAVATTALGSPLVPAGDEPVVSKAFSAAWMFAVSVTGFELHVIAPV